MTKAKAVIQRWWWEKAGFCGCGNPEVILIDVLSALQEHGEPGGPDLAWQRNNLLMMYCLDAWGLTEHGGGLGGAWLTPEGIQLRDALMGADFDTVLDD